MSYHINWLGLDFSEQLINLGFRIRNHQQTRKESYVTYAHGNGMVVIDVSKKESFERRIYVIRNGFSLNLYDEVVNFAGSIIKANMDNCLESKGSPIKLLESMLNTLGLEYLIV